MKRVNRDRKLTPEEVAKYDKIREEVKADPEIVKTFTCREDVLRYFGAKDEAQFSKAIYKSTSCGAWAKFEKWSEFVCKEKETWTARFTKGINGIHLVGGWASSTTSMTEFIPQDKLPSDVRLYCGLENDTSKTSLTDEDWQNFEPDKLKDLIVINESPICKLLTFTFERDKMENREGLVLGSIVEGSDAEVTPERLAFPFTDKDFDQAIKNIEFEADMLWKEANGDPE